MGKRTREWISITNHFRREVIFMVFPIWILLIGLVVTILVQMFRH